METRTELGMSFCSLKTRIILNGVRGRHKNWLKRNRIWLPRGRNWWKTLILMNPRHFLITQIWNALNVNVNRTKLLLSTEKCANHEFLLEQLKKDQGEKTSRKNSRVVLRHGKTCSKMRWERLRAGNQKSGAVTNSWRKNLNQLDNYQEYAHNFSWHPSTWHVLVDQTFCGLQYKLAKASTKWTQACDRRLARLISYI